jgi:NADPH:quinone reductase-like Zn-dependent oxidoreductase
MEARVTMNAIRSHRQGGPETLVYEPAPRPAPGAREVLVEVKAAAITPTELTWEPSWTSADGKSRLPMIPSHEISGLVAEVGPEVRHLVTGEEVYGLIDFYRDGGAAEYVVAAIDELATKPRTVDHIQAAALPLSALTVWQAFRVHASLQPSQRVLIHGGAGGVGSYAVQLAKKFGAYTIATCSSRNAEFVRKLGADRVLLYDRTSSEELPHNIDLVLDTVGGETLNLSFPLLRPGGRLISVVEEPSQEEASHFGVDASFFIVEPNRGHLIELAKLVDDGSLRPIVSKTYQLSAAREAYEYGLSGHMRGKIVLSVP